MDFTVSLVVVAVIALQSVYCQTPPNKDEEQCSLLCTLEFRPVCGSDFITYANECALKYANCVSQKVLKRRIDKYYDGDCSTGMAPLFMRSRAGQQQECPNMCPLSYKPVCGSDTKTYPNVCAYQAAACQLRKTGQHVHIAKLGRCIGDCRKPCTREAKWVCGSNGLSYINFCQLEVASCVSEASGLPKISLTKRGRCIDI